MGEKDTEFASRSNYDAVDFNFRRLRLTGKFQGAYWYGGILDIRAENLLTQGFDSKSALQEANLWFKPQLWNTKVTLGQFKIPFLREQITSSSRLLITERAFSARTLQQWDIGLLLTVFPLYLLGGIFEKNFVLDVSVTNGDGSGHTGTGLKSVEADLSEEPIVPLYNWRLQYNPFGGVGKNPQDKGWTEGEELLREKTLFSIGIAGAYSSGNEGNQLDEGGSLIGHTIDLTFYSLGVYLNSEYTLLHGSAVPPGYHTFQATFGYNILIFKIYFMPLVRYNYLHSDFNRNNTINPSEQFHEIWLGFNLLGDGHDFKLQFFYLIRLEYANKEDNIIYFQAQTNFESNLL